MQNSNGGKVKSFLNNVVKNVTGVNVQGGLANLLANQKEAKPKETQEARDTRKTKGMTKRERTDYFKPGGANPRSYRQTYKSTT